MASCMVELSEYDIQYGLRGRIKSQVLAYFLAEFNLLEDDEAPQKWTILVEDASNIKGSSIMILLEEPGNILIEEAYKFEFKAINI